MKPEYEEIFIDEGPLPTMDDDDDDDDDDMGQDTLHQEIDEPHTGMWITLLVGVNINMVKLINLNQISTVVNTP